MGTVTIIKGPGGSSSISTSSNDEDEPGTAVATGADGKVVHLTPDQGGDIPFNVVLVAVLGMICLLAIIFGGMRHEQKKLSLKAAARTPPDDGWRLNVEQRLATIERIVTDTGTPLAHQIEALRTDARANTLR